MSVFKRVSSEPPSNSVRKRGTARQVIVIERPLLRLSLNVQDVDVDADADADADAESAQSNEGEKPKPIPIPIPHARPAISPATIAFP